MDSTDIDQPVIRITRDKIHGNDILKTELNQSKNGETFVIKNSDTVLFGNGSVERKKNEANGSKHRQLSVNVESLVGMKVRSKRNAPQTLFQKHFRTNGKNKDEMGHFHKETDTEYVTQSQLDQMVANARDITKQPIVEITRNKIYGNNISNVKLDQRVNGGIFRKEDGKIVFTPDECTTETKMNEIEPIECNIERNNNDFEVEACFKRILLQNYFANLSKMGNDMRASCKKCKSILRYATTCESLLGHLKVCKIILLYYFIAPKIK